MKAFNPYEPPEGCVDRTRKHIDLNNALVWVNRALIFLYGLSAFVLFFYFRAPAQAEVISIVCIVGALVDVITSLVVVNINEKKDNEQNRKT